MQQLSVKHTCTFSARTMLVVPILHADIFWKATSGSSVSIKNYPMLHLMHINERTIHNDDIFAIACIPIFALPMRIEYTMQ